MPIIPVLINIRSAHNVGSIMRSAECFGLTEVWCAGITPYPHIENDSRLPHIAKSAHEKISKTALGAENHLKVSYFTDAFEAINALRKQNFAVWAVEQQPDSTKLHNYTSFQNTALLFGNEPNGLPDEVITITDGCIEISQYGHKESLNVSVAAGIVLYEVTRPN